MISKIRPMTLKVVCSLSVACLGLFTALPMKAASLQYVSGFGSFVPSTGDGPVGMYIYVPDNVVANPPILVELHYCGGTANGVFGWAGGLSAAADKYGFIIVVPQALDNSGNARCWDPNSTAALTRNGGGDTQAIVNMVNYTVSNYSANKNRVYVVGDSSGGMTTEALLAVYPDVFMAGAEFSGIPAGADGWGGDQMSLTPQQWGDKVRAMDSGYTGYRPRIQLWHGTADTTVSYNNQLEAINEWSNVLGFSTNANSNSTVTISGINNQWTHQVWADTAGDTILEAWSEIGGGHNTDATWDADYVIPFFCLNQTGSTDPVASRESSSTTTGGTYKLLSRYSGKALDANNNGTANGTQIIQWTYGAGANQQWRISSVGNNLYSIIGVGSGKCIDISGWGTTNDTKVQLWDYVGGSNQKFYFNPTTNGYYEILPSHATGSCLDVQGPSTADGAVVHLWQWVNATNQQWLLQPVDGTAKLISQNSGKCLCPYGGGTANGTQIHQWDYINSSYTDQQWTLTDTGSGNYKFINVKSGRALDVSGGGTANQTKVQLWDDYSNTAQLYKVTSTEVGQFRISPNCAPGSCLDVSGVSTANGAVVQLWQWLNQANQKWSVQAP